MPHVFSPSVPLSERQAFTMGEAASLLGLSISYLYILRERGLLRTIKIGGRRLVPRDALDELLGARTPPSPPSSPPKLRRSQRQPKPDPEGKMPA